MVWVLLFSAVVMVISSCGMYTTCGVTKSQAKKEHKDLKDLVH